nr:arginine deiminase family protein [Candidatus Njordarchaeota archaeon]
MLVRGATPKGRCAVVREVPETYDRCVRTYTRIGKIDVELAKKQHELYCRALQGAGLKLIRIPADDSLPDCVFVEDPAIVYKGKAIMCRMGVESRVGEVQEVRRTLSRYVEKVEEIKPPGTIEGGDVLRVGDDLFIGLTARTNMTGIDQVREILKDETRNVTPVRVSSILHLKSACSYVGDDCIVVNGEHFDLGVFSQFKLIRLPKEEAYAANCLAVNDTVFIIKGYPRTKRMIEKEGFVTEELDVSEFKKGEGSLTCLSIIF